MDPRGGEISWGVHLRCDGTRRAKDAGDGALSTFNPFG